MFTQTHRLIGATIGTIISREYPDRLDEKAFRYGCVIPDFYLRFISIPHYKHKSFEFITTMIQKERCLPQTIKEKRRFSAELGIITHYISDYFCQAHNYSEYDNVINHFIYEGELSGEFRRFDLQKFCLNNLTACNQPGIESPSNLPAFIHNRHLEYQNEKRQMKTDITFCMDVSVTVVLTIIAHSQLQILPKAA